MDELRHREQVELIREVFSYQSRFDGTTMVIKIDYPVIDSPEFPLLVRDLALLRQTGIQVVIVPGAKERIDEVLARFGESSATSTDGVRISRAEAIPFIKMAAFDAANRVMTLFSAHKVNAVVGNYVRARSIGVIDGIDYQNTGKVDKVNVDSIRQLLSLSQVPIFPCIGWSSSGKPYNLSSDELAVAVAQALGAVKIFFISDRPGYSSARFAVKEGSDLAADGRVIRLTVGEVEDFVKLNAGRVRTDGEEAAQERADIARIALAGQACKSGIERIHLVDGRVEGVILKELFSSLGIGTMVYAKPSDSFRPLKERDIPDVLRLMQPLVEKGILRHRDDEEIRARIADFVVAEADGMIQACGALHPYQKESTAEIGAIAVNEAYSQIGLGRRLMAHLIDRARAEGLKEVFVLTTQTPDWFESLGFKEAGVDSLPPEKRAKYDEKRKSKVLTRLSAPLSESELKGGRSR